MDFFKHMKLKRIVQDFQVEEQIALTPGDGPFAIYRLTKQSLGTLEALEAIVSRWKLRRSDVAFAGLKDKHALTTQYVTIAAGPRRGLEQTNLSLKYVGQADRAIHASDIASNRFEVVIRDLGTDDVASALATLESIERDGCPNYFDNQRFGSLGESGEFIARPWCLGDYERAMWLAVADANVRDRPDQREAKRVLRDHWGDWTACAKKLRPGVQQEVAAHLARYPTDFRRAMTILPHELRSLWLAAFQSHLWNQVLAASIQQVCRPEQCAAHTIGGRQVPLFIELDMSQRAVLHAQSLPLPSARLHLSDGPMQSLYDQVFAAEGIELRQVRVKYPRDTFFSKGERDAVFTPNDFSHEVGQDELYPGPQKLTLRFTLSRGSYATILVKRVIGEGADALAEEV
jgi:tRNA pseudouridine13 synthase